MRREKLCLNFWPVASAESRNTEQFWRISLNVLFFPLWRKLINCLSYEGYLVKQIYKTTLSLWVRSDSPFRTMRSELFCGIIFEFLERLKLDFYVNLWTFKVLIHIGNSWNDSNKWELYFSLVFLLLLLFSSY